MSVSAQNRSERNHIDRKNATVKYKAVALVAGIIGKEFPMNVVTHNLTAMNTMRQYNIILDRKKKSTERLSSGYRINRSADDAAGLSISEKMRLQIRGLHQASRNIQDGMSVCQVADGALQEVQDMLHRMNELAIQASNDTNTSKDREAIDKEIQQLKQGMKDIFSDTSFNTMKLFQAPNVPEVTGQPNDMQVFNSGVAADGSIIYGGISIGNIRYTWEEMGVGLEADGRTFTGGTYSFQTWDGEEVCLETEVGAQPPKVSRKYTWSADDTGIYVNKKLAATWGSMGVNPSNPIPGDYDFDYHGMNIEFQIPGDILGMDELIDQINGDNLNNVSWNSLSSYTQDSPAVDIVNCNGMIQITEANKDHIIDLDVPYYVAADDTGVTMTDYRSGNHTKMTWEQFRDISGGANASNNGGYPIVDWGLDNDQNEPTDITFDDTAEYEYHDDVTGFRFQFKLADEASLQAVKNGLDQAEIKGFILDYSETTVTQGTDTNGDFSIVAGGTSISFATQLALGRNFDQKKYDYTTKLSVTEDSNDSTYQFQYKIKGASGEQDLTFKMAKDQFENWLETGGERTISFLSADGKDKLAINIEVKKFQSPTSAVKGTAQYQAELQAYETHFLNFMNQDAKLETKETDYLYQRLGVDEKTTNNTNAHTAFNVKVNPPEKLMQIQASDRPHSNIDVRWDCLSVGILGLSGTNTQSFASSQAAMGEIQKALNIISEERSTFGAYQNRMEHARANVDNSAENIQAAESAIRDSDMAEEMVQYARDNIIAQVGEAILAQEKQNAQGILRLLE